MAFQAMNHGLEARATSPPRTDLNEAVFRLGRLWFPQASEVRGRTG